MAKAEIKFGELGGGGGSEWITPTLSNSNKTASASWDFDADSFVFLFTMNSVKYIFMGDKTAKVWYASNSTANWQNGGTDSRITITERTFSITLASAMSDVSFIPLVQKPNGYFS